MAIQHRDVKRGTQASTGTMTARVLLVALLATLFLGCSPTIHEMKAPVVAPPSFSDAGTAPLPDKWWLTFEDTVLNTLMERALSDNFSLKSAWDRLSQAEAVARIAGADLSPILDADAGVTRSYYREAGQTGDNRDYSLGLSVSYEVDLWGRIRSSRDAVAFDARASQEDLRAAALTLSSEVAATWFQLVEQFGQLDMLDAQIATNQQVLELVTLQFRTGQVGIADMLQQQQLVESNRGEKAQAMAQAKVFEHQLAILLGALPQQSVAPRVAELPALSAMPKTGLPAELIQGRPDIRSAYYAVLSADSDVAAAIADRFPRLSLSAGVDTSGAHTSDLFDNWLATLAGNLVAPIIDGGQRRAEVDRTRGAASEALNTYGQTILTALGEVEDALVQEARQRDVIASLEKQLQLAGDVVERVRDRYLKGSLDYQRVLDALISQQALQRSLLTAELNIVQDRIDLCRALGTGWELERPEKNQPKA